MGKNFVIFLLGAALGFTILLGLMFVMIPKMMLTVHQSKYGSVEETCVALQASIKAHGWNTPEIRNMNKTMENSGVIMRRQVRLVELCKADYAKDILTTNPEVSTLMPCAWGVYEGEDGKVYVSGMNMGLMGKIFGGNIAKVMGGSVAKDELSMLKDTIK